ncbi:hypothetical protein diail_9902 [Diaporthe ilicicola]|nr:hypothetical protein diail_9902 [Diaporthe ilicicola]
MRAVLEVIAPQQYSSEHEFTAEEFYTGSPESIAMHVLQMIIYLETNNMIHQFDNIVGFDTKLVVPAKMLEFLRNMRFLTKGNIDWLGNSANPTKQLLLQHLLNHAIVDESSLDVLDWLMPAHFDVNHSVHIPGHYSDGIERYRSNFNAKESWPLLHAASLAQNVEAVRLLLARGADPYKPCDSTKQSPLECAARLSHRSCDRALRVANLLLSEPKRCSKDSLMESLEGALQLAIAGGNTELVLTLLRERKCIGQETISARHLTLAAKHPRCDTLRLLITHAQSSSDGTIELPRDILFSAFSSRSGIGMIKRLEYLLDLGANPSISRCSHGCGQGFILNYMFCARFQTYKVGEDLALRLFELLRKNGCPPERPEPHSRQNCVPSTIQLAVRRGYTRLVKYLLDWGVDVDYYQEDSARACGGWDALHDENLFDSLQGRSPLLTALYYERIEIAKILLRWKPKLKLRGGEQGLAMAMCDDAELVSMLLKADSTDTEGWETSLDHALSRGNPESVRRVFSMSQERTEAVDTAKMIRALLVIGDHDQAYQQIEQCYYTSDILFEAIVQSPTLEDSHEIVTRILNRRPARLNDNFEIRAVALAAIEDDLDLLRILMEHFRQGPWVARLSMDLWTYVMDLRRLVPDDEPGISVHILEFAAFYDEFPSCKGRGVLDTLLAVGVSASGMYLDDFADPTPETWKRLIVAGADPNHAHPLSGRSIDRATERNMLAHVELLCEARVPLNQTYTNGYRSRSAIQIAFEYSDCKTIQLLLDYGADVNCTAGYLAGATCLQLAAGKGKIGLVHFLLQDGTKVNGKRSLCHGRTAIEIAAENGRTDVLKLLLLQQSSEHLFQTAAERFQFIRAAKFAEEEGHFPIVTILKDHIDWDSHDQQLFDQLQDTGYDILHIDDMTERVPDSQPRDAEFWAKIGARCRQAEVDIEGIREWIGMGLPHGDADGCDTAGNPWGFEGEGNMGMEDDSGFNIDHALTAAPQALHDQFDPLVFLEMQDDIVNPSGFEGEGNMGMEDDSGFNIDYALTAAPQALHDQFDQPVSLEMPDDVVVDNMIKDYYDEFGTYGGSLETLSRGTAMQNVNRCQYGMVLGEVVDEVQHINEAGNTSVDNIAEPSSDVDLPRPDREFWENDQIRNILQFNVPSNDTYNGNTSVVAYVAVDDLYGSDASDFIASVQKALPSYAAAIASNNNNATSESDVLEFLRVQASMLFDSGTPAMEFRHLSGGGNLSCEFWGTMPFARGSVHINTTLSPAGDSHGAVPLPLADPAYWMFDHDTSLQVAASRYVRRLYLHTAPLRDLVVRSGRDKMAAI